MIEAGQRQGAGLSSFPPRSPTETTYWIYPPLPPLNAHNLFSSLTSTTTGEMASKSKRKVDYFHDRESCAGCNLLQLGWDAHRWTNSRCWGVHVWVGTPDETSPYPGCARACHGVRHVAQDAGFGEEHGSIWFGGLANADHRERRGHRLSK